MKTINTYISEKLIVNNSIDSYNYHPKTKSDLIKCILDKIKKEGLGTKNKPLDLNDIDVSQITDMSSLFDIKDGKLIDLSKNGYFDISNWNVSNVENMNEMFYGSNFNGDISNWNVSKVRNMKLMFGRSKFNNDISSWDVSNVVYMMFMFTGSNFDKDISDWDVSNVEDMVYIFTNCPLQNNPPKWYKYIKK